MMTVLSTLAMVFGTFAALGNVPQTVKIFHRKSAKDISILTYTIFFIGAVIWTLYGMEIKDMIVTAVNAIGAMTILSVMIGWFIHGR